VKVLVVGCGRVGGAVALNLKAAGWEVSVIDEREEALGRLGDHWTGEFHVGHGMDISLLRQAGVEDADAVVVTTDGDNSNIVIGQMAQKSFGVRSVIVRILAPTSSRRAASTSSVPRRARSRRSRTRCARSRASSRNRCTS
jgi:trk system potassium uptake protein TrkA